MGITIKTANAEEKAALITQEIIDRRAGEKLLVLKRDCDKVEKMLSTVFTNASVLKQQLLTENADSVLIEEVDSFIDIFSAVINTMKTVAEANPEKYDWVDPVEPA